MRLTFHTLQRNMDNAAFAVAMKKAKSTGLTLTHTLPGPIAIGHEQSGLLGRNEANASCSTYPHLSRRWLR